ncbi:MAG: inorganic phosphate transporter [Nitrososphaerales archaeon]|jgi:PiT family inorganic phosphate transporter
MASEALLALGVVLAFVFGWNNSSFLIGNGEGSGSLTLREALIVSSAGLLLGVALEGSQMLRSLSGSVTPVAGDQVVLIALVVSLSMTIVLSTLKLPVSFSMAIVGAFAGAAYGSSLPLNGARLEDIATFWFLSPILAAVLAYAFYRVIVRSASRLSLLAVDGVSRYGVILTTLIIAYVLGANNIGLIYGMTLNGSPASQALPLVLVVVAIVGMVALGRGGISGTIGDRLLGLSPFGVVATFLASAVLIWTGTQLAIPISISQCLLGGMFGAAFTKQTSAINTRLASESIAMWVVVPVGAFLLGFLLVGV